ncbi:MAG: PQQ-binding-like beta-propeller repeat protein [Thermoanaerobaculia bacterium]|jgi:outer membrane protein assembly factor BamB
MAKNPGMVFIGIGSYVVALDGSTGTEIWRRKLKASSLVTIQVQGEMVLAGVQGEVFCLDARSGDLRWHNKLKGLGMGIVCFGTTIEASAAAMIAAQAAAVAAAT